MATETTQMSTANATTMGAGSYVGAGIPCQLTLQSIAEQYGSNGEVHWEKYSNFYMVDALAG